jgi:endonuclease/exonuclease/phosphatase (EEP) superfamily protein YafD
LLDHNSPAFIGKVRLGSTAVSIVGAHPYPPSREQLSQRRNAQLRRLAELVNASGEPTVLVGDLNTTSWSPAFADFLDSTGLRDSRRGFGVQPSWPTLMPLAYIPIDHCLVSPEIVVKSRKIGRDVGSDHLPVIALLDIPETGDP